MPLVEETCSDTFHTQLSAILEKLAVFAVEEIKQLVWEYCAVLREELSREKKENGVLKEKLQPPVNVLTKASQDGHSGCHVTEGNRGQRNEEKTAEEQDNVNLTLRAFYLDAQETLRLEDCEFGPGEKQPELADPPELCPSNPQEGGQHKDAAEQFCRDPLENSKDLLTHFKQPGQSDCQFDVSSNGDQPSEVVFHIKREPQSPDIQILGEDGDMDSEVQRGIHYHTYANCGDPTMADSVGLISASSRILDIPDLSSLGQHVSDTYTSSQRNQFRNGSCHDAALPGTSQDPRLSKYACDFCGKAFPYQSELKRHQLSHTKERTQVCAMCGKGFIRKSHLRRHELQHLDYRPFTCKLCGRNFSRNTYLKSHMKTHSRSTGRVSVLQALCDEQALF